MVKDNVDILLISETKIDSSFPTAQFNMNGFTTYRCDININGGGITLYVREDIPSSLLKIDTSIEALYVEINVRKKKWLIGCSYNPHKGLIAKHLTEIGKDLFFLQIMTILFFLVILILSLRNNMLKISVMSITVRISSKKIPALKTRIILLV